MSTHVLTAPKAGRWARLGSILLHELREVIPPTLFFFVGFNLILFTKRLFLADYLVQYTGFFIATTGALIVGKVNRRILNDLGQLRPTENGKIFGFHASVRAILSALMGIKGNRHHVRVGSLAGISRSWTDVCYCPNNGHAAIGIPCRLGANRRHMTIVLPCKMRCVDQSESLSGLDRS